VELTERVAAGSSVARNLDTFFMLRAKAPGTHPPPERTSGFHSLLRSACSLAERNASLFFEDLLPALALRGAPLRGWEELSGPERRLLQDFFVSSVFPVVTPLAVDSRRPFPHIFNLSLNIGALIKGRAQPHFACVSVPSHLPRFLHLPNGVFVPLEDSIAANIGYLFPGAEIVSQHAFRVTRRLEFESVDANGELPIRGSEMQWHRRSSSVAVRLEAETDMPAGLLEFLIRKLRIDALGAYKVPGPLDLSRTHELCSRSGTSTRGAHEPSGLCSMSSVPRAQSPSSRGSDSQKGSPKEPVD
jgi:polyphosphate kinase